MGVEVEVGRSGKTRVGRFGLQDALGAQGTIALFGLRGDEIPAPGLRDGAGGIEEPLRGRSGAIAIAESRAMVPGDRLAERGEDPQRLIAAVPAVVIEGQTAPGAF